MDSTVIARLVSMTWVRRSRTRLCRTATASSPAPPCRAVWSPGANSQPRPLRSPPGPGPAWTVRASRASVAGSSDGHPVPRRTRSAPVDQSPAMAGTVATWGGNGSTAPSAVTV